MNVEEELMEWEFAGETEANGEHFIRSKSNITWPKVEARRVLNRQLYISGNRLCGLVVPGYTTEMYCDSCEVRTEFIYVM
jgi:hypothetical protein